MSYNSNFYNKYRDNNATFHSNFVPNFVPPPPTPPPFFIPPPVSMENSDQEFVRSYEQTIPVQRVTPVVAKPLSISDIREKLQTVISSLNDIKTREKMLMNNINVLSEEEWSSQMKQIQINKALINSTLECIKGPCLDVMPKLIAKRTAKRLRMKRVRQEIKREKELRMKELKERSRKIDENLQRIKDDIIKAQQEQEAKLEADVVLKEVLRKKHDAKKCIVKLEALVALRKARQNTAKGRGESVSETECATFLVSIEKLKAEWTSRLSSYEGEELELRAKLKEDSSQLDLCTNVTEREVASNLDKWREALFGGEWPQADFKGDVTRFIALRSQWDQYISSDGTTLPMGWVPPPKE